MSETERGFDWDDVIEKDGAEFVLLPEGDYTFTVESFERGRHPGSAKLPPCNKAILGIRIQGEGSNSILLTHNLFLHTKTEGMLSAFFSSIGQKKQGEKTTMNWGLVPGSTGRCKVGIHKYKKEDGEERTYNDIKKFYPKEEKTFKAGEF